MAVVLARALGLTEQMAQLARSVASLRVFGDDLKPDEVTRLLGHSPSRSWRKGEFQSSKSGRSFTRRSGAWLLEVGPSEPEDFDGQVAKLLGMLTNDHTAWSQVTTRFEVDLFCGWFMGTSNEGLSVSPSTMSALGRFGIELSLDIYGPDSVEAALAQQAVQGDGSAFGGPAP